MSLLGELGEFRGKKCPPTKNKNYKNQLKKTNKKTDNILKHDITNYDWVGHIELQSC